MRPIVNIQYNRQEERHLPQPFDPFHTYSTSVFVQSRRGDIHWVTTLTVGEGDNMVIYKSSETYNSNALQIPLLMGNPIGDKKTSGRTFVITLAG